MKRILLSTIISIAFATAQANLVVDSLGVVNMEEAQIGTSNIDKLNVDSMLLINGNRLIGYHILGLKSNVTMANNFFIKDYSCGNSFYNVSNLGNTYAFSIGSARPTAYFYNCNSEAASVIVVESENPNAPLFTGQNKNSNGATALIRANGMFYAKGSYVTMSDRDVKENIETVSNSLEAIQEINPVSYTFKTNPQQAMQRTAAEDGRGEGAIETSTDNEINRPKYGFIAEEIEEIFPNVVYTMPSGDKGIAYQELIPILVSAIQEQQAEIENLSSQIETLKAPVIQQRQQAPAAMQDAIADGTAALMQNTPNPFNRATEIGYRLPEGTATALIMVCDMNGKMLQTYPLAVNSTNGTLTIQAGSYTPGMYLYTLIIDGVQIDTKQMIILAN